MKFNALIAASGLAGMAHAAAVNTTSSAVPSATQPCAVASAAYAEQIAASPSATPTIAAAIAHDCLLSVPLGKEAAIELVDSIEPYLEWQSGLFIHCPITTDVYSKLTECAMIRLGILGRPAGRLLLPGLRHVCQPCGYPDKA